MESGVALFEATPLLSIHILYSGLRSLLAAERRTALRTELWCRLRRIRFKSALAAFNGDRDRFRFSALAAEFSGVYRATFAGPASVFRFRLSALAAEFPRIYGPALTGPSA